MNFRLWQQTLRFPPRAAVSHPFLYCSPASSLVSFPPALQLTEFCHTALCGRRFLQDVAEAVVTCRFPRTPALPPALLLAHSFVQENCATRPLRACAKMGRLCWVSIVLHGNYVNDAPMTSLKLISSKYELWVCAYKLNSEVIEKLPLSFYTLKQWIRDHHTDVGR